MKNVNPKGDQWPSPAQVHRNVLGLQRIYRRYKKKPDPLPCDNFEWLYDVAGVQASVYETYKDKPNNSGPTTAFSNNIAGVLKYLDGYEDLTADYRRLAKKETAIRNDRISENKLSDRQQESYVKWDDVITGFNAIDPKSDDKLWVGLSVLFAPRRLDWLQLRLADVPGATLESLADLEGFLAQPKSNWIVQSSQKAYFFVFDSHKEHEKYGRQVFTITNNKLKSIIKAYVKRRSMKPGMWFATYSNDPLPEGRGSAFMSEILRRYFNKTTSQTTLRTSFATFLGQQKKMNTKVRGQWASMMGHDILTSLTQYNKVDG